MTIEFSRQVYEGETISLAFYVKDAARWNREKVEIKVRIVTDSGCDLPLSLLGHHGITSVPVEPDPGLIRRTYLELAADGDPIVSIHVSSRYIETVDVARGLAAELRDRARIEVFDSLGVSLAEGLLVLRAAVLAETGAGIEQICGVLQNLIPKTHALIAIDDLGNPRRTGKINGFQHFVGSMVGLKPIVGLSADGAMDLIGRAFSPAGALKELLRLLDARMSHPQEQVLGVFHTQRPDDAEALGEQLQTLYQPRDIIVVEAGPSTVKQTGLGALGVAFFSETERG